MSIHYCEKDHTITLQTVHTTYQMKIDDLNTVLHTYYGEKTADDDMSYAIHRIDRSLSGNPAEIAKIDRSYSLDTLPQEYSGFGTGDYRITAARVLHEDGTQALRFRYAGHEIMPGKYSIPGLPAAYDDMCDAMTLALTLKDTEANVTAILYYGVFEQADVITRTVKLINDGPEPKVIHKAASLNLDFIGDDLDMITFYGRWARERTPEREHITHGIHSVGSVRGTSSPHYSPSVVLCDPTADEFTGSAYGVTFVYSCEFELEIEKDMINNTRLVLGIHPDNFAWTLQPGEAFDAPEVILTYSNQGISTMSNQLHRFIRKHIVRGPWRDARRPVLINNWEGTYFDFDGDKLVSIAADAASLGVEMFVLDDGWFGKRDDDNSGLGDWFPNEKKLGCTIEELGKRIKATGVKFGIWFEPEAVSEDSDLYRAHPDWAVTIPGREPNLSRNELILDLSRTDVQDYLIKCMSDVIRAAQIDYVKWDYNRSICDKYTHALPKERQGEMTHRFVLGTYRVLEALLTEFPNLLIEGCSSGGGRFDAGMMYYTPQIWCSDDTDPIERLEIQYGTSFIYPVNTMGAHVSAAPNHQTGRISPLDTRGVVAMSGTFGYELDINKMTAEEKEEVKRQISVFKELYNTIQYGNYYRLTTPFDHTCTVWEEADEDGKRAVVNAVYHTVRANPSPVFVKVKGLKKDAKYTMRLMEAPGTMRPLDKRQQEVFDGRTLYTGQTLMTRGFYIPEYRKEYQAWQIIIEEK